MTSITWHEGNLVLVPYLVWGISHGWWCGVLSQWSHLIILSPRTAFYAPLVHWFGHIWTKSHGTFFPPVGFNANKLQNWYVDYFGAVQMTRNSDSPSYFQMWRNMFLCLVWAEVLLSQISLSLPLPCVCCSLKRLLFVNLSFYLGILKPSPHELLKVLGVLMAGVAMGCMSWAFLAPTVSAQHKWPLINLKGAFPSQTQNFFT